METLSKILFIISNGLMIPVILLLLFFFVRSITEAIRFFSDISRFMKIRETVTHIIDGWDNDDPESSLNRLSEQESSGFTTCVSSILAHRNDAAFCERTVANFEVDVQKKLSCHRNFIKFGPMLGLMGTLIPMGPALVGLASGDISSMAYNMQVAFATTVVGMATAAIGVALLQFNQRHYARSLNDLEFILKKLTDENNRETQK